MKKLTLILMTLAAIFIFAGCGNSPKSVALKWGKAIAAGDLEKANKYSTPDSKANNEYMIEQVKKGRADFDKFASNLKKTKAVIDGDTAKLVIGDDKDGMPMKKIDGKWKVDASRL